MPRVARVLLTVALALTSGVGYDAASPSPASADDAGVNPDGWYGYVTTTQAGDTDTGSFSETATWHLAGPGAPVTVDVVYHQTAFFEDFWCTSTTVIGGSANALPASPFQALRVQTADTAEPLQVGTAADYVFASSPGVGGFDVGFDVTITEKFSDENNCSDSFSGTSSQPGWSARLPGYDVSFVAPAGWTELHDSFTSIMPDHTYSATWRLTTAADTQSESSEPSRDNWGIGLRPNSSHFNGYAQSFTASDSGVMTSIELIFSAVDKSTELIPVEVRDGGGLDGSVLARGWLSQAAMPIYDYVWEYAWVPVKLSDPFVVSEGEQYTIVVGPLEPSINSETPSLIWWGTDAEYSRGSSYIHDTGWPDGWVQGWTPYPLRPDADFGFRTFLAPEPADTDSDDDGVLDTIDVGDGAFDDGVGTTGSIISSAGNAVSVQPDQLGVRIEVAATAAQNAVLNACGFDFEVEPGSVVVVKCGSITTTVVQGTVHLLLDDGAATVSIPAGVTAHVVENADGSFSVQHVDGEAAISVTVDGSNTTVLGGDTLHIETWDFVGFAAPVDAAPTLNVVKAGQNVPLKWRVLDAAGAPVTDLTQATVSVTSTACSQGVASDLLEQTAAAASTLQNLGNGYYQFNWKSAKTYSNSCRLLGLDIGDGVVHAAMFRFTK
jgi:hypothetical protein